MKLHSLWATPVIHSPFFIIKCRSIENDLFGLAQRSNYIDHRAFYSLEKYDNTELRPDFIAKIYRAVYG